MHKEAHQSSGFNCILKHNSSTVYLDEKLHVWNVIRSSDMHKNNISKRVSCLLSKDRIISRSLYVCMSVYAPDVMIKHSEKKKPSANITSNSVRNRSHSQY